MVSQKCFLFSVSGSSRILHTKVKYFYLLLVQAFPRKALYVYLTNKYYINNIFMDLEQYVADFVQPSVQSCKTTALYKNTNGVAHFQSLH